MEKKYFGFKNWDKYQTQKKYDKARLHRVTLDVGMLDDPKVYKMTPRQFTVFIKMLLIARKYDNRIPLQDDDFPSEWAVGNSSVIAAKSQRNDSEMAVESQRNSRTIAWIHAIMGRFRGISLPDLAFMWRLGLLQTFEKSDSAQGRVGKGKGKEEGEDSFSHSHKISSPSFSKKRKPTADSKHEATMNAYNELFPDGEDEAE